MFASNEFDGWFGLFVWLYYLWPFIVVFSGIAATVLGVKIYIRFVRNFFKGKPKDSENIYYRKGK